MRYQYIVLVIALLCLINTKGDAQAMKAVQNAPEVGKPMPDFQLRNVSNFRKKNVSLSDFRGRWLFLDLWYQGCSGCITGVKHANELHTEFKAKLDWVIVAANDQSMNSGATALYRKLEKKQHLTLPVAFDSILYKKWKVHAFPHIIIIDPGGVVKAITNGIDIDHQKIEKLINGNDVSFFPKERTYHDFDPMKALSKNDSSLKKRICSFSMFTEGRGENQWAISIDRWVTWPSASRTEGFRLAALPLKFMYNIAWYGTAKWSSQDSLLQDVYPEPILETEDTTIFQFDYRIYPARGVYNYIQVLPEEIVTRDQVMKTMREDLSRSFNHEVTFETRSMRVWKLISLPGAENKIRTKGGAARETEGNLAAGFEVNNFPMKKLVGYLTLFLSEETYPVVVNETSISGNIDFSIDADMTDLRDINRALKKNDLQFVHSTRKMKVMVIRDKLNQ